jgi:[acyl-carrier-protein] S-malonyltransferase
MVLAFLFPGQGARHVLEGVALAQATPPGAALIDLARSLCEVDPFAHEGRALERTEVLQPVLTAVSLAVAAMLRDAGVSPSVVIGHSLGELAAYAVAGAIDAETAVRLAALRGRLMAREAMKFPGSLVTFPSLTTAHAAFAPGLVGLAAVNAPGEIVAWVSAHAPRTAQLASAPRVPVSGPWHSPLMAGAVDEFRHALSTSTRHAPKVPVIRNVDGTPAPSTNDAVLALADQLVNPVAFMSCIDMSWHFGVQTFVTVGPGAVLRGLMRKNHATDVLTTENAADLARTLERLRA